MTVRVPRPRADHQEEPMLVGTNTGTVLVRGGIR
jgi:hypothetical protein